VPTLINEDDSKYGDRDITSGSLVFRFPKGNEAWGKPLPESIYKPQTFIKWNLIIQ
jgi:hypothetical protein